MPFLKLYYYRGLYITGVARWGRGRLRVPGTEDQQIDTPPVEKRHRSAQGLQTSSKHSASGGFKLINIYLP